MNMLHHLPLVSPYSWNPSHKGMCPCVCVVVCKRPRISAPSSDKRRMKLLFGLERLERREPIISRTIFCANQIARQNPFIRKEQPITQNVDLPTILPKNKKKPFPIPFKKIQKAASEDKKLAEMGIEKPLQPPKNGVRVPDLIPLAYEGLDAWKVLIKGVAQLLHTIPVYGCSECSEVHVAPEGHQIKNCLGPTSRNRHSLHLRVKGSINDMHVPIESYHLCDPFGRRIKHETRFDYERIPAVVELCIHTGVDIPEGWKAWLAGRNH